MIDLNELQTADFFKRADRRKKRLLIESANRINKEEQVSSPRDRLGSGQILPLVPNELAQQIPSEQKPVIPAVETLPPEVVEAFSPKDYMDELKDVVKNPIQLVPFFSSGINIYNYSKTLKAAYAYQNGEASPEDEALLLKFADKMAEDQTDRTFGGKVVDVLKGLPAFAGELLATAGIGNLVKKGVYEGAMKGLERAIGDRVSGLLAKKVAEFGIKIGAGIAGGTAQVIPARGLAIGAETLSRLMPDIRMDPYQAGQIAEIVDNDESVIGAIIKSAGNQWIEIVSERSGGIFDKLITPVKERVLKIALFRGFMQANPGATPYMFNKIVKNMGWNGVLQEIGEERLGDVGHAIMGALGDERSGPLRMPSLEQWALELVSFSIPGVGIALSQQLLSPQGPKPVMPGQNPKISREEFRNKSKKFRERQTGGIVHAMPDGSAMEGKEHPEAVPGSERPVTVTAEAPNKAQVNKVKTELLNQTQSAPIIDKVSFSDAIEQTGRTPEEAKATAEIYDARVSILAKKTGKTKAEFYKRLSVQTDFPLYEQEEGISEVKAQEQHAKYLDGLAESEFAFQTSEELKKVEGRIHTGNYTIESIGKKWVKAKPEGKDYTIDMELNSISQNYKAGETVSVTGKLVYDSNKYGTKSYLFPMGQDAIIKEKADESSGMERSKILQWLGYMQEAADKGYIYQNGRDTLTGKLHIGKYPDMVEKYNKIVDPVLNRKKEFEQMKHSDKRIDLQVPYEKKDDAKQHGAKWDRDRRTWFYVGDKLPDELKKYTYEGKVEQENVKTEENKKQGNFQISEGSGYGGTPHTKGEVLWNKQNGTGKQYLADAPEFLYVLENSTSEYFREDGLSFGVGDDSGSIYTTSVRTATEEESKELKSEIKKKQVKKLSLLVLKAIEEEIKKTGTRPGGTNKVEGEVFHDTQNIYGGGEWFIVQPDKIWYIQNNGMDGDNWANNNIATGGAGAIGWWVPYTDNIADKIKNPDKYIDNSKLLFQGEKESRIKGSTQFADNQIIIRFFESADASTGLHEVAHIFRRDLATYDPTLLSQAEKAFGVKSGEVWTVQQEEDFARSFEAYVMTGKAPSRGLQKVFDAFKEWLTKIYKSITGLDVKLSGAKKTFFDKILGETGKETIESKHEVKDQSIENKIKTKGMINKLISDSDEIYDKIQDHKKTKTKLFAENISTEQIDQQIESLTKEYDILDMNIADIMTTDEYDILGKEKILIKAKEIDRLTKEIAKATVKETGILQKLKEEKIRNIKQQLLDYVNGKLDKEEKSVFLTAVKNIKTDEQLSKQIARVDEIEKQVHRRDLVSEIKKMVDKASDSNQIAIEYVDAIKNIMTGIDLKKISSDTVDKIRSVQAYINRQRENGEDVTLPNKIYRMINRMNQQNIEAITTDELEAIRNDIERLIHVGKTKLRITTEKYEREKEKDLNRIMKESKPLIEKELIQAKIGEGLSVFQIIKNKWNDTRNFLTRKHMAITPIDVMFDMIDGTKHYKGVNYEVFKKPVDKGYNEYLDLNDKIKTEIIDIIRKNKLNVLNFDRVGVHAAREQDGGTEKLINSGYPQEEIDGIKLTDSEMKLYDYMRKKLDSMKPEIDDVMRNTYNEKVGTVKNYFSFMTDFEKMTDFEIREKFGNKIGEMEYAPIKKNTEKGFTKTRVGGSQKIKINALEVFLRHFDNALYLIKIGPVSKRIGEIAATEEYGKAVGKYGQQMVREWIDVIARKGKTQGDRIHVIDILRKNIGAATLGLKLSSALIQPTALLDGAGMIGKYVFDGAWHVATSRKWRVFLKDNFPELRNRIGDDPAYLDFGGKGLKNKIIRTGFWPLQNLDKLTASSIVSGAYSKYLKGKGMKIDFDNPNKDGIEYAQLIMRRTQSSSFFKDAPSALTQGKLTGNKSLDKLILQFQSFMLNRWSLIEHDMIRTGIKTKDAGQAMNIFFFMALAVLAETSVRLVSKEMISAITGNDPPDWKDDFPRNMVRNALSTVPFISQIQGMLNYGSLPVPSLSMLQSISTQIWILKRTKNPDKITQHKILLLMSVAGFSLGVPGTFQAVEVVKNIQKQYNNDLEGLIEKFRKTEQGEEKVRLYNEIKKLQSKKKKEIRLELQRKK